MKSILTTSQTIGHTFVWLPEREGLALLSGSQMTDTAIVYVHGFWGDAETTWNDIIYYVDILDREPFGKSDLFFFDYPAEENILIASVKRLKRFVEAVYPNPPPALFHFDYWPSLVEPVKIFIRKPEPYKKLVLVGHSLGGVVIRRLIADELWFLASEEDYVEDHSVLKADVRLFAPAHLGFRPSGRMKVAWESVMLGDSLRMLAYGHRVFEDLKENSEALLQLRRDTEEKAKLFPKLDSVRPFILWGEREGIVSPNRYDTDPPNRIGTEPGRGHTDVCKVDKEYFRAAYFVCDEKALGTTKS